jgi:Raf kinase inhibitor-like YbhB/YbcL family protein
MVVKEKNINPPIVVKNVPVRTQTLALILEDPDASKGTFDHWVAWNILPDHVITEGSSPGTEGNNGAGKKGYTGPCPLPGTGIHHYHFHIYALDTQLDLKSGAGKAQLKAAMKGHILAEGELVGLCQKRGSKINE